jgi:hypothetical protein
LANSTRYFWRVLSLSAYGKSPTWSQTWSFTTLPPAPNAPVLLAPSDSAQNVSVNPILLWNKRIGSASYHVQISIANDFSSTTKDSSLTDTSASLVLIHGTHYYWRVNATNAGGTGSWSALRGFTTVVALPGQTQLAFPVSGDTVKSDSAILAWHPSSPAITGYYLEVGTDSTFTNGGVSFTLTDTTKMVKSLVNGATYFWRVQAQNAAGSGPYSSVATFIVRMPPVEIIPKAFFLQNLGLTSDGMLRFGLAQQAHVTVKLFNLQGKLVKTLINEIRGAGTYTLKPEGLPGGSYALAFRADKFYKTIIWIHP